MTRPRRITIRPLPRIYCASSLTRAAMWREWVKELKLNVEIVSTWHMSESLVADDANESIASRGWRTNVQEITDHAEHFLAYGEEGDPLNGTLVETGIAIATGLSVYLVGSYPWGSWRHLPFVYTHPTLHSALVEITKAKAHP